eukprot:1957135-Alexandrium_andersonii.AAC.1
MGRTVRRQTMGRAEGGHWNAPPARPPDWRLRHYSSFLLGPPPPKRGNGAHTCSRWAARRQQ